MAGEGKSVPVYQIWDMEGTITDKEDRPAPIAAKPCINRSLSYGHASLQYVCLTVGNARRLAQIA